MSPYPRTLAAVFAFALLGLASGLGAAEKPHIILVMADDQGWGDMAYAGHEVLKTPNFDAAAAEGLRFDRFYAAAPVCSPTRASVLTGRHPNRMGVFKWGYPMRPQETTLAEALKSAGYTTGHFGKWHLGSVRRGSPANPGNNGFDRWLSAPNFYDNDAVMSDEGTAVQMAGESSFIAMDAAIEWISEQVKGDKPVFAVVWFGSPHHPHRAVAEDKAHYEGEPYPDFLGEVTGMDRAYGKLRQSLVDLGIKDDTLLWYCSDNGALPKEGSTGGHRGNKGKVYEGGLLVPAILEWPAKIPQPRHIEMRCNTSDLFPTLIEIAGAKVNEEVPLDGVSLVPLIEGDTGSRKGGMGFWDHGAKRGISTPSDKWMGDLLAAQKEGKDLPPHPSSADAAVLPAPPEPIDAFPGHAAWIERDWKLHRIEDPKSGEVKWEIYNLAVDPYEETDLSATEHQFVKHFGGRLEAWLESVARSLNGEDYE